MRRTILRTKKDRRSDPVPVHRQSSIRNIDISLAKIIRILTREILNFLTDSTKVSSECSLSVYHLAPITHRFRLHRPTKGSSNALARRGTRGVRSSCARCRETLYSTMEYSQGEQWKPTVTPSILFSLSLSTHPV